MRALIVDDSRSMRMILRRVLTSCGVEDLVDADDGARALEVAAQGPVPDVVFIDWNMPEMSGIDVVRALRADDRYSRTALVMVTSETAMDHVEEALGAGADEYIMKPFTAEIVSEKLELVLAGRQ